VGFLLEFWKPIAAVLAIIAVLATAAILKGNYDERKREEGRNEVRMEWHQAVVAQQAREEKAAEEADRFQRAADAKREADFKTLLAARSAEIQARLAARNASVDLSRSLSDATRAANNEGTGKSTQADPTAATVPNELAVAEWFDQVASQYRACRERVDGWIKWDDERVAK
jgi:Tfp pilus assembly protein PilV